MKAVNRIVRICGVLCGLLVTAPIASSLAQISNINYDYGGAINLSGVASETILAKPIDSTITGQKNDYALNADDPEIDIEDFAETTSEVGDAGYVYETYSPEAVRLGVFDGENQVAEVTATIDYDNGAIYNAQIPLSETFILGKNYTIKATDAELDFSSSNGGYIKEFPLNLSQKKVELASDENGSALAFTAFTSDEWYFKNTNIQDETEIKKAEQLASNLNSSLVAIYDFSVFEKSESSDSENSKSTESQSSETTEQENSEATKTTSTNLELGPKTQGDFEITIPLPDVDLNTFQVVFVEDSTNNKNEPIYIARMDPNEVVTESNDSEDEYESLFASEDDEETTSYPAIYDVDIATHTLTLNVPITGRYIIIGQKLSITKRAINFFENTTVAAKSIAIAVGVVVIVFGIAIFRKYRQ